MKFLTFKESFVKKICIYLIVQIIGITVRTYVTHSSTVVWIVNFLGLIIIFFPYFRLINKKVFNFTLVYCLCGIVTVIINLHFMNGGLKALGTNVNILIAPIIFHLCQVGKETKTFNENDTRNLLKLISLIGTISYIIAWITGYNYILRVLLGRLSPYRADTYICGFYYSKNIYGAVVALSSAADLYIHYKEHDKTSFYNILLKVIAVILSFSRAALLQMVVMLFSFFWFSRKRAFKEWVILFLVFAGIAAIVITNPNMKNFLIKSVIRPQVGDAGRMKYRRNALAIVSDNLLSIIFGVGYAGIANLHIDIDNTYYYLFFSGGMVKVLFFLWFAYVSINGLKRLKTVNLPMALTCASLGISYLFFAFFESVAIMEIGLLNFLFTLFLFLIPYGTRKREKTQ